MYSAIFVVAMAGSNPDEWSLGTIAIAAAAILVFCVPPLWLAWRIERAGLLFEQRAVVVRGPLRTWTVPLEEVVGFDPGERPPVQGVNGTHCPRMRRAHGRPILVWALGRDGVIWNFGRYLRELEPECDELNAKLRTAQDAIGVTSPQSPQIAATQTG